MKKNLDNFIRSLDVPILRNVECEKEWCYDNYSDCVTEALAYHCSNSFVSEYLKFQISQIIHQGYVLFGETPFAVPVRVIYEAMERVVKGGDGRGRLKNISNSLETEVLHIHCGQSSCITENWVNHARKTKLTNQAFTQDVVYKSLISSLSKPNKTGEWLVYSKSNNGIKFWCIWLHSAGDEQLIRIIRDCQCA